MFEFCVGVLVTLGCISVAKKSKESCRKRYDEFKSEIKDAWTKYNSGTDE